MAFLLLLHQKMSLQRKVNKLTLAQVSISTRKERMQNRIGKVQKAYAKKQSKLDAQAKLMTSYTTNMVNQRNMMMSQYLQNVSPEMIMQQSSTGKAVWEEMNKLRTGLQQAAENGLESEAYKQAKDAYDKYMNDQYKTAYDEAQRQAYDYNNKIAWQRQMEQQQMNAYTTSMNDQVSIWLEAQKQALEDEEQMALAPLEEEQTQIDLEEESNNTALTYAKSRLDAIEQALESQAQKAPKFGA